MPLEVRSIFLSDVHLGTPDCQADYLLDFLRSTRSSFLYLVGDIIDIEALARRSYWPRSHAAVVAELLAIAARGCRVVYIPGNHDAPLRGLAGRQICGVDVALHDVHVADDGRRYRVSHGDEFDLVGGGRAWLDGLGERGHRGLSWMNRRLNALRRRLSLPYLPFAIIAKSRLGAALSYIRAFEQRVAADCAVHGFDGHICGHIHFGDIRDIAGTLYLNDGDWVEHCTALVEHHGGAMELLHWCEHRTALADSANAGASLRYPSFAALTPERVAALRSAA